MTDQTLGRRAETALQDIQQFMEGYKPLRHRLYSMTEKYQQGLMDAPGTKALAVTSAVQRRNGCQCRYRRASRDPVVRARRCSASGYWDKLPRR